MMGSRSVGLRVHLLESFDDDWIERLKADLDTDIEVTSGEPPTESSYEVLVAGVPERRHLTASDKLRSLVIPWSGLPKPTRELMLDFPHIAIYNLHHNAAATAEMAVALMLAAAKSIVPIDHAFRSNDWSPRYKESEASLLDGKRAVILGYGAIGRRIAGACHGLGMHVDGVKREAGTAPERFARVHAASELDDVLRGAQVLFVCVPLTPDTRGLIGARELALLADDAIVVNVARGRVIDETALYDELKSGRLRAGLDVWYLYPQDEAARTTQPPSQFPFHELDNVVMTPHIAGHTRDVEQHRRRELAQLLNSLTRGAPPPHRVDPQRGY
jgi:phosphoglycerate dehydrogenase-like enzyme